MKVRYTLPVHGVLRKATNDPLSLQQHTFRFEVIEGTDILKSLVVEISNIPKMNWPTLTKVEQDPAALIPRFPFERNKDAICFSETEPWLRNLESYLALFGLEGIDFDRLQEEWITEPSDDVVSMEQSFALDWKRPEGQFEPISNATLAHCIVASRAPEHETLFLAYFRLAQTHWFNRLYIEVIRYSYLCIESLFAEGKFKSTDVRKKLLESPELMTIVSDHFYKAKHGPFERIRGNYPSLRAADPSGFVKFVIQIAGQLRHANKHPNLMWHPSQQHKFENEAACIFNVAEQICFARVIRKLNSVMRGGDIGSVEVEPYDATAPE